MEKYQLLSELKKILIKNNLTLSSAESCTGGLISSYLTDIDGASAFIMVPPLTIAMNQNLDGYLHYPIYVQDMSTIYWVAQ